MRCVLARAVLLGILLVCCQANDSNKRKIIGFAIPGGVSHQAGFATIGLELARRGHKFAMLLSSGDDGTHKRLAREPFHAIRKLNFSRGPTEVGTESWLRGFKRDPKEVWCRLHFRVGPNGLLWQN